MTDDKDGASGVLLERRDYSRFSSESICKIGREGLFPLA
jgi:hypothetical protein